jgi:hypothetical protein
VGRTVKNGSPDVRGEQLRAKDDIGRSITIAGDIVLHTSDNSN